VKDRAILNILELKLNSYSTRNRDLELKVVRLNKLLGEKELEIIKAKEKPRLTKNNS